MPPSTTTSHYMDFVEPSDKLKDRVGGLPTLAPPALPWNPNDGKDYAFLMELWTDDKRLPVPSASCIQFYQCLEPGSNPLAIALPSGYTAPFEDMGVIKVHPDIREWSISYREVSDPNPLPEDMDRAPYFRSKLGGEDPTSFDFDGRKFLGFLKNNPVGFDFAGLSMAFYWKDDKIEVHLL